MGRAASPPRSSGDLCHGRRETSSFAEGRARPLLEKLAQDPDTDVAFRAQYALEEIDREAKAGA